MTHLPQFIHGVIFVTFLNAHLIEKLEDTPPSTSERTHNIAIIGAGLSGLTATLTLVKNIDATNGLDYKIRVLEATDRIGGRVKTVTHDSKKFETGATFVNTEHTKIRELAAELNQTLFDKPAESFEQVIYLKNRSPEFGAEFNEEILTCVHDRQVSQYETVWENYDYESSITVTDMLQKCNATDYYETLAEVAMRTEMGIDASECPAWLLEESWNIDLKDKLFQVFGNVGDEASYYQDGAESFVWKLLTRIIEISDEKSIGEEGFACVPEGDFLGFLKKIQKVSHSVVAISIELALKLIKGTVHKSKVHPFSVNFAPPPLSSAAGAKNRDFHRVLTIFY